MCCVSLSAPRSLSHGRLAGWLAVLCCAATCFSSFIAVVLPHRHHRGFHRLRRVFCQPPTNSTRNLARCSMHTHTQATISYIITFLIYIHYIITALARFLSIQFHIFFSSSVCWRLCRKCVQVWSGCTRYILILLLHEIGLFLHQSHSASPPPSPVCWMCARSWTRV